jgi:hypothetical protein
MTNRRDIMERITYALLKAYKDHEERDSGAPLASTEPPPEKPRGGPPGGCARRVSA